VSRTATLGLAASLESTVQKLHWEPRGTEWSDYYSDTNYSTQARAHKEALVGRFLDRTRPTVVWDLGANTGVFSALAAERGAYTVAFDRDPAAVERHYRAVAGANTTLPLVMDLGNPSTDLGWDGAERRSLARRGPADVVLALALVHHLAIGNNVPLERIASFFARLGHHLIVEFVPKSDSQVARLLATRVDIFVDYDFDGFERAVSPHFEVLENTAIDESERRLYLLERRSDTNPP